MATGPQPPHADSLWLSQSSMTSVPHPFKRSAEQANIYHDLNTKRKCYGGLLPRCPPPPPAGALKRAISFPAVPPCPPDKRYRVDGSLPPMAPSPTDPSTNRLEQNNELEEGELEEGEVKDEPIRASGVSSANHNHRPPPPKPCRVAANHVKSRPPLPPPKPPPRPPLHPAGTTVASPLHNIINQDSSPFSSSEYLKPTQLSARPKELPTPTAYGRTSADFKDAEVIGKGTYGEVFRAIERTTGQKVALKKMSLTLPGETNPKEGMAITLLRELKALQKLKHKNIVRLLEIVTQDGSTQVPCDICLVLEFCEMDLSGIVRTCALTSRHVKSYMTQIFFGLDYIQKQKLLHRDLKTANILVTKDHVVKIADWGLCRFEQEGKGRLTNPVVTLWYRAPELLLGTGSYDGKIDIWSCGAIFTELLTGRPFLDGRDELNQLHKIFDVCGTPKYSDQYTGPRFVQRTPRLKDELQKRGVRDERAIDLCEKLLSVDPRSRPTADEAADDDFFWSKDEHGQFWDPYADPALLPRLVPFKPGVDMACLHELEVKRR